MSQEGLLIDGFLEGVRVVQRGVITIFSRGYFSEGVDRGGDKICSEEGGWFKPYPPPIPSIPIDAISAGDFRKCKKQNDSKMFILHIHVSKMVSKIKSKKCS